MAGSTRREDRPGRRFAWGWVWLVLITGVAVGVAVVVLLWGTTPQQHKDAFDTGWKSAAAVLAVLAAVISVRRLQLSEQEHQRQLATDEAARADAVNRQITDLSAKASEQLGSDSAAVRIGGLTDLERLGQSHPQLRQVVVDRICAYLRAPFLPPPGRHDPAPVKNAVDTPDVAERRLEMDVRRTAQQVLARHLRWPKGTERPAAFWDVDVLDLRDAVLTRADFTHCRLPTADFRDTHFHRNTKFTGAIFDGQAVFGGAVFSADARFDEATFAKGAWFDEVSFAGDATFTRATFTELAFFPKTTFARGAHFREAVLPSAAELGTVTIDKHTPSGRVPITVDPTCDDTTAATLFVQLDEARVIQPNAGHAWPPGWRVTLDADGTGHLAPHTPDRS